jgi:cell division protein FtsL
MIFVSGSRIVLKVKKMTRKTNTILIGLLGTILMGLATWVVITMVELQVLVMMIQQELMDLDKVIGRIYSHMDRLSQR